jgi:hypothetical protein
VRATQASGEGPKRHAAGTDRLAALCAAPMSGSTGGVIEARRSTPARRWFGRWQIRKNGSFRRQGELLTVKIGSDVADGLNDLRTKSQRTACIATRASLLEVARSAPKKRKRDRWGARTTFLSTKTTGRASRDPCTTSATDAGAPSTVPRPHSARRCPRAAVTFEKSYAERRSALGLAHRVLAWMS